MKLSIFTFPLIMFLSHIQLIGQNTLPNQNMNFEIAKIGEHGFCREGDTLYYKLEITIKNNTKFKLRRTELCASINNLWEFESCSSKNQDSIWYPQSDIKYELFVSKIYRLKEYERLFDRTPESILLSIKINTHNIDKDFNELVSKYSIEDDWKNFQKVLGFRDMEFGEKLKIIEPPVKIIANNSIHDPNDPLDIFKGNYPHPDPQFLQTYWENKSVRDSYNEYVKLGIYDPFEDLKFPRQIIYRPSPVKKVSEEGLVIVEVTVNREGIVTEAKPVMIGTTNTSKKLFESAKNAALQTRFNPEPKAPEYQTETLKYRFSLH